MEVDHQQHGRASFPSTDAHFNSSSELHQQQQQSASSPSISQQSQSSHQQQQQAAPQQSQQPSPESPSASLSQNHAQTQAAHPGQQQQGQNQQWPSVTHHHQQHPHLHLLPISVPLPGTLPAVSASPTSYSPASAHTTDGYPFFPQQTGHPQAQSQPGADGGHRAHGHGHAQQGMERSASLSLNISSLSVQSPANLSPLTPSPHPSTASTTQTLSPITPLSPSTTPHAHHYQTHTASNRHPGQGQGPNQGSMFAYAPPSEGPFSSSGAYDSSASAGVTLPTYARAPSSRSSSAASTAGLSTKSSIPRKRSFHNAASMSMNVLEVGDPGSVPGYNPALSQSAHDFGPGSFEEVDVDLYSGPGGMDGTDSRSGGSPGEGESSSGDGDEDPFKALSLNVGTGSSHTSGTGNGLTSLSIPSHGAYGPVSAKTTGTNNFVTKLYQMINDPKSAMFIQWTELGTSFVVSNVGEFSRTILGTHFKHNNFSSFVRQLNMYGFHKINRGRQTPRGGRTSSSGTGQNTGPGSADQQVWEFSHHKFLRGRPDLLDEIKRKALDPDPGVKQRVELPGELAAQLNQMRDHHRRVVRALEWERAKVDKLVGVVRQLSDVVSRAFPGSVAPFPPELWEPPENNPPIFITSPSAPTPSPASASSRGYGSINGSSGAAVNGMALPNAFSGLQPFSPGSSPTASEFAHPSHAQHGGHYASTAYQHHGHHGGHLHHLNRAHSMQNIPYDTSFTAPSPVIGGPRYDDAMELDASLPGQGIGDRKRQRTGTFITGSGLDGKRLSRARSDSAPLGYGAWGAAASAPPTSAGPGTGSSGASSSLGRPRSGSGLAQMNNRLSQSQIGMQGRRDELMVNISGIGNSKNNSPGGQSPSTTSPLVPKAGG